MNKLLTLVKLLIAFIPVILLLRLDRKANLKKEYRSRQFLTIPLSVLFCIAVLILSGKIIGWIETLSGIIAGLFSKLGSAIPALSMVTDLLFGLFMGKAMYFIMAFCNFLLVLAFILVKSIFIRICKLSCNPGSGLFDAIAPHFYEPEEHGESERWYVRESCVYARRFLHTFYIAGSLIAILLMLISMYLYEGQFLKVPFFPVLGIMMVGELYFFLDGITRKEAMNVIVGEKDAARNIVDYSKIRKVLRSMFGDKLLSDDTTASAGDLGGMNVESKIEALLKSDSRPIETYGKFMNKYRMSGHVLDQNYVASGLELLKGNSVLFNNPFYYDLIPYIFYAMNHHLLMHRKVLIILGRHGLEDDVAAWCEAGLRTVANVAGLWRIGCLTEKEQELDVGIIIRSNVQNLELHRVNRKFFEDSDFIVLIEPSKLLPTAQIGLNSVIRRCRFGEEKKLVFCSADKNCDGLLDALSHALMTSLSEVSSTEVHEGVNSYMCWTTDTEYWQHRMIPNISRYLGVGTELSFLALKHNVSETYWYGGERFPVTDMHWIAKQYYGQLLPYAGIPGSQDLFDNVFVTSHNLWNAKKRPNSYLTVEDESNNLFEMKREFSTRTTEQGFVNIITSPYLLCDYMAENGGIFNADSKAIPYIVADYAMTKRNILLRLCLQMAEGYVWEDDMRRELLLADAYGNPMIPGFWKNLCIWYNPIGVEEAVIRRKSEGRLYEFDEDLIRVRKRYNVQTGREENAYSIDDEDFIRTVLGELSNARYIAEEELDNFFIGTEIMGQVYQKYLPGQFFTLAGKYYEMLGVTYDGRILVRRAADHINGRKVYRQERSYCLKQVREDGQMGSRRVFGTMEVIRQYADISVDTPAYWELDTYQDFAHGRRVTINGIPQRVYNNKWILKIAFPEIAPKVRYTLAALFNEVFRSLFAENQDMIVAVTAGEAGVPLTYGLNGDCREEAIYIIEDSQYDIGLLTAVERNLTRIYQIICDYLQWNQEEVEKSVKQVKEGPPDYRISEEDLKKEQEAAEAEEQQDGKDGKKSRKDEKPEKKKGFFAWIASLFRKKSKKEQEPEKKEEPAAEGTSEEAPAAEDISEEAPAAEAPEGNGTPEETASPETAVTAETPETEPAAEDISEEAPAAEALEGNGTPEETASPETAVTAETPETEPAAEDISEEAPAAEALVTAQADEMKEEEEARKNAQE